MKTSSRKLQGSLKKKTFPNNFKISMTDKINLMNVAPADTSSQTDSFETSHFPTQKVNNKFQSPNVASLSSHTAINKALNSHTQSLLR